MGELQIYYLSLFEGAKRALTDGHLIREASGVQALPRMLLGFSRAGWCLDTEVSAAALESWWPGQPSSQTR